MKKILPVILFIYFSNVVLLAQVIENSGKPLAEIFADFHYSLSGQDKTTGFSMTRAQFGYNYFASENFSALVKVDIGTPSELADGSVPRRYAYFREASVTYAKDKLNISFGMTSTKLYEYQQRFLGKRYVANTFQTLNGYGYIADLGISVNYKFSDIVEADATLMNGEGYINIQLDNSLKPSLGVTVTPIKGMAIRAYSDLIRINNVWQSTSVLFAGFKNEKVTIGAEINFKSNIDVNDGHDAWGFSGTGAVCLTKKIEFFGRYDYATSKVVSGDGSIWNLANDGSLVVTGFQYEVNKMIKIALDYQGNFPADQSKSSSSFIYVNTVFKF